MNDITINSGAAFGSDYEFLLNAQRKCFQTVMHSFSGHNFTGNYDVELFYSWSELKENLDDCKRVFKILGKSWNMNPYIKSLQLRSCKLVDSSDVILGVGIIKDEIVQGGTGNGIMYAAIKEKPIFFYDQNNDKLKKIIFKKNINGEDFKQMMIYDGKKDDLFKIIKKSEKFSFAGIGTRKINQAGKSWIKQIVDEISFCKRGI